MTDDTVLVPGGRDVRGTLDTDGPSDACVVACPPHPQHRGHRGDARLTAVSDALPADVDCLRIDYGAWDEGRGERSDVARSVAWARDRYDRVGLFGFSFGGTLALVVAARVGDPTSDTNDATDTASDTNDATDPPVDAVAALAPTARISERLDAVAAVGVVRCPTRIVYGTRDDTADWRPVIDRATERDDPAVETVELAADHFFVGQHGKVADRVAPWLADHLRE
ncbi:MAG: alpha/beta hydrolase [Halobaculum sp.]